MEFNITTNSTQKPHIQVLRWLEPERENVLLQIIMFFTHYMIVFPIFLLCWYAVVNLLKRRGHLSQSEADNVMDELKNVKISMPKQAPIMLSAMTPRK